MTLGGRRAEFAGAEFAVRRVPNTGLRRSQVRGSQGVLPDFGLRRLAELRIPNSEYRRLTELRNPNTQCYAPYFPEKLVFLPVQKTTTGFGK